MKCPKSKQCKYYEKNSYTCNNQTDRVYCGVYRKLFIVSFISLFILLNLINVNAIGSRPVNDGSMVAYFKFTNDSGTVFSPLS